MAIQKSKLTAFGVTGNYWRIKTIHMNLKSRQAGVTVELYVSKDLSNSAQPLEVRSYHFGTAENPFPFDVDGQSTNNVYELAYAAVKQADPELSDGSDV